MCALSCSFIWVVLKKLIYIYVVFAALYMFSLLMTVVLFDIFLFMYQSARIALEKRLFAFAVQVRFSVTMIFLTAHRFNDLVTHFDLSFFLDKKYGTFVFVKALRFLGTRNVSYPNLLWENYSCYWSVCSRRQIHM